MAAPTVAAKQSESEDALINFDKGKTVVRRWKVLERLGAGGCGSVYKVECTTRKGFLAALKVEKRMEDDHGVLKLEVATLLKMKNCKNVVRLLESGCRANYNYMVMTLCGYDLMALKRQSKEGFCESTLVRIGIYALYAIKQVHEMGFVHRDVKPGNMMNGAVGRDKRMFFLIDYGMTRSFIVRTPGKKISIRKPRSEVLLRGTLRYCSLRVHERKEQGRVDDLWAMLYMLVELYVGLPWHKKDEEEVRYLKQTKKDAEIFFECPPEFIEMAEYLRTLTYESRPDYFRLYEMFMGTMRKEKYSFLDKYDWEEEDSAAGGKTAEIQTALECDPREEATGKPLAPQEVEYLLYPCTRPQFFKEKILDI